MFRIIPKIIHLQVIQYSKCNYIHYPHHADIHFIKITEKKDFARKSLKKALCNMTVRIIMENPETTS